MNFTLLLAAVLFILVALSVADLGLGVSSMKKLRDVVENSDTDEAPIVSVIVPARNEEANIESALLTLLRQGYRNLEVVAVDDRSIDDTGKILDRLRQQYPERLAVFHLTELPGGWMGKNHALAFGAGHARGEYLLFTDGDVHMEKSTISRAMIHMRSEKLDHISLLFSNTSPGILLNSLILDAGVGLLQCFRPWRARIPSSPNYMGVGAFNLLRRTAYDSVGGFASIRMHPVDDIMLGKLIKRRGFHQECLLGHGLVSVPWYASIGQMIEGMMKNILALIHYRFVLVPPLLAVLFFLNIFPLWGMVLLHGPARVLCAAIVLVKTAAYYAGTRLLGISPWCALGALASPYILMYTMLKAAWRNARDGGIYWRGTHYALDDLRKNEKLLF